MFANIPIGNYTGYDSIQSVAVGTSIQLKPNILYEANGKLFALDPSGVKAMPVYNSIDALVKDYDTFQEGAQVYIRQTAIADPRLNKQYAYGAQRGSIIATIITSATIILIIKLIIVLIVVAGIVYCVAQLTKTPVTTTKKISEQYTAVTAPDGTTWIIDNQTGEVIDKTTGTAGIFAAAAGLVIIGAGTFVGVKYLAPAIGNWLARRKKQRLGMAAYLR